MGEFGIAFASKESFVPKNNITRYGSNHTYDQSTYHSAPRSVLNEKFFLNAEKEKSPVFWKSHTYFAHAKPNKFSRVYAKNPPA